MGNPYAVGCSDDTPRKLDAFEHLMRKLLAVYANVILNPRNNAYREITVIDWNAGCGRYLGTEGQILEGTPIITARRAQHSIIPVHLICVDHNPDSIDQLNEELKRFTSTKLTAAVIASPHEEAVSIVAKHLESRAKGHKPYGVAIFDPNGRPQDACLLNPIRDHAVFDKLDVLAHYATAVIKWLRNVKVTKPNSRDLNTYLFECHGKKFWSIQKPPKSIYRQPGWFLGSASEGLGADIRPLGMINLASEEGRQLFDELNYTKKERKAKHNGNGLLPLFDAP